MWRSGWRGFSAGGAAEVRTGSSDGGVEASVEGVERGAYEPELPTVGEESTSEILADESGGNVRTDGASGSVFFPPPVRLASLTGAAGVMRSALWSVGM